MTKANYNHIYNALVADDNDIVGKLAYSQYKRQKIEYILAFKEKHGELPKDADLAAFHDMSNNVSVLESYRSQAAQLAVDFLKASLADETTQMEEMYAAKASHEIRSARPGFWTGVSQSVIGSACFIMLLRCLVFFTWSLKQGPRQVIEQVFDVMIVDAATARSAMAIDDPKS
jgi:hypothetical protein